MELDPNEQVVWKGRPAYHVRYPILDFFFFIGIFVIELGPIGQAIAVTSFFLLIVFLIMTVVSFVVDNRRKYYLTNNRVISHKFSVALPDLSNVRMEQSRLAELRGVGNVFFDSRDGRWIVFKHVKDPKQIVQSGMSLRGILPGTTSTVYCNYCGSRVPAGLPKCPTCGADM